MIDLESIARLISAARELLPALGNPWQDEPEDEPTQKDIRTLVQEQYEILRSGVGSSSMRILAHLDGCGSCEPELLILEVDPRVSRIPGNAKKFVQTEFGFRLAFLKTIGVVSDAGPTEFRISHLGKNFVREARYRREYPEVFSY